MAWLLALALPLALPLAWLVLDGLVDEAESADVALILGNTVHPDGTPSQRLRERLQAGLALYRAGKVRYLLVSGGTGVEGHSEADVMGAWLCARGVPRAHVVIDAEGATTQASARNTAEVMKARGWSSVIAVSQYFHVTRSKLALRTAGAPRVSGARAEFNPTLRDLYSLPREVAALYVYGARARAGE